MTPQIESAETTMRIANDALKQVLGGGTPVAAQTEEEKKFMGVAKDEAVAASHDDACSSRKGRDCNCRDNLRRMNSDAKDAYPQLEEKVCRWDVATFRGPTDEEKTRGVKSVPVLKDEAAVLVRVDDGKVVERRVADPISPNSGRLVTIEEHLPPRWVCLECAQSMRSNSAESIDHRCDDADLARTKRPIGLERTISPEVRFGGGYRLTLWRDKGGEFHIGEQVVTDGKVVDERHLYGPDSFPVVEQAILDFAVTKLSP